MRCHWVLSVLLVLSLGASPSRAQNEVASAGDAHAAATQAARAAAQKWLRHVDTGAWARAWDAAAPGLRDTVAQERWRQRGVRARRALGPVRLRRLMRARYHDALPQTTNAGPYVLLQYHAAFRPGLYVETVLAVQTDEAWRVVGYEVAPVSGRSGRTGNVR